MSILGTPGEETLVTLPRLYIIVLKVIYFRAIASGLCIQVVYYRSYNWQTKKCVIVH